MGKRFQETFLAKVKESTIKSRKNHRIEKYQINQEVRISSFIIQPLKEKNYVDFKIPDIVSKSQAIEDWKVKAKIIQEMRNYVKVKIISKQPRHDLKLSHRKVEFRDEKISLKFNFTSLLYSFHAKIIWDGYDNYLIWQIYFG